MTDDKYAQERIEEKLAWFQSARPREGLRRVADRLRHDGVPPLVRLHLISSVTHLSREAAGTLRARVRAASRAATRPKRRAG